MPVIPHLYRRIATAASDTRILDSRQLASTARSLATHVRRLFSRAPSLSRRNDSSYFCQNGIIQDCYITGGPAPGAVAGIVLGSIVGFLLLMWILWTLSTGGGFIRTSNLEEEDVVVRRRSRSPNRGSRRSTHNRTSTYQAEMRRSSPRRERVIRQERIVRDVPVTSRNETSRVRESIIVEERPERRMDGDDIVEVIEEHSSIGGAPPPRRKSGRRQSNTYNR